MSKIRAEEGGEVRAHGVIQNRLESVRKMIGKLGPGREAEVLLRGWANGLRSLLAADAVGGSV